VCTMGDEVNLCVARRGRSCRRSKGVSITYGPADATATHHSLSLAPANPDRFYLPGFTFLVPAHPGSPGQNPEEL